MASARVRCGGSSHSPALSVARCGLPAAAAAASSGAVRWGLSCPAYNIHTCALEHQLPLCKGAPLCASRLLCTQFFLSRERSHTGNRSKSGHTPSRMTPSRMIGPLVILCMATVAAHGDPHAQAWVEILGPEGPTRPDAPWDTTRFALAMSREQFAALLPAQQAAVHAKLAAILIQSVPLTPRLLQLALRDRERATTLLNELGLSCDVAAGAFAHVCTRDCVHARIHSHKCTPCRWSAHA